MAKLSRATLSSDAVGAVRSILVDPARFRPGQKVSVEELARELGVSRSPVWSAVARLEAEGLLNVSPRQGVFLVDFDPVKLTGMFEAREALEGMAARLAANRAAPDDLDRIGRALTAGDASLQEGDQDGYAVAALEFHVAVADASRSPVIGHQLVHLYTRAAAMCRARPRPDAAAGMANQDQHRAIAEAIRARSGGRAEKLAREHVIRLRTLAGV